MPYYDDRFKVKCPYGDIVDGSKDEYRFDFGIEEIPKEQRHLLKDIIKQFGMLNKKIDKGVFPIYCRKHHALFLYDFEAKKPIKPRDETDLKRLELIKQGIQGVLARSGNTEEIKIST